MTQVELRYCPFCGSSAQADYGDSSAGDVRCSNLDCPLHELLACTVDEWNTRTPSPATGCPVAKLAATVSPTDAHWIAAADEVIDCLIQQRTVKSNKPFNTYGECVRTRAYELAEAPSPVGEWIRAQVDDLLRKGTITVDGANTLVFNARQRDRALAAQAPKPTSAGGEVDDILHRVVDRFDELPEWLRNIARAYIEQGFNIAAEADTAKDG